MAQTKKASKTVTPYVNCLDDMAKYQARSEELQKIVQADQKNRDDWFKLSPQQQLAMAITDRERRQRVGAIFGEGCFKSSKDYAAAALIFQHGDQPDHYFQTFLWSKRAYELGDKTQKRMMALGIYRYLVKSGYKQLFGGNASKDIGGKCYCLDPVEPSFPESKRVEYMGTNLVQQLAWVKELNKGTDCPAIECKAERIPSPAGIVPGFW